MILSEIILNKIWSYVAFPGVILKSMEICSYSGNMLKKMELQRFSLALFKTPSALSWFLLRLLYRGLFEDKKYGIKPYFEKYITYVVFPGSHRYIYFYQSKYDIY